jgi:uncharacterized protein
MCGEPAARPDEASFPFCSTRCKRLDLGNWLDERYRMPDASPPDAAYGPDATGEDA